MTHRHAHGDEQRCVEIDEHVCLRPTVHGGNPDVTDRGGNIAGGPDEHLYGFIVGYDWPGEEARLEGAVCVDPHGDTVWSMTGSLEGGDLTLSPSIQAYMYVAGDPPRDHPTIHGYVRNGKWVPA